VESIWSEDDCEHEHAAKISRATGTRRAEKVWFPIPNSF
jgi:hypothetical protein